MSRKAFFSTVIVIFALFFLMFFITIRSNSTSIKFDDSPRLLALKSEEAYSFLDKNLTYDYINSIKSKASDCNVNKTNIDDFNKYLYGLYKPAQINSFCNAIITKFDSLVVSDKNYFDANISLDLNCSYRNKDLNYTIYKNQNIVFHKRYKSWGTNPNCKYVLTDLDADLNYIDTTK